MALNFLKFRYLQAIFVSMVRFIFFIFFLLQFSALLAQSDSTSQTSKFNVVKDLRKDWLTVDENNEFIPFIENTRQKAPVISFLVNLAEYDGYWLELCIPGNSTILIERQVTSYYEKEACVRYRVKELMEKYNQDSLLVTIYYPKNSYDAISTAIVSKGVISITKNIPLDREKSDLADFFVAGFVLLLISYALLLNNYPKAFKNFHSSKNLFSSNIKEDTFAKVTFVNRSNLIFIIHYCFLLAYLFIILNTSANILHVSLPGYPIKSFSGFFVVWLELAGIALVLVGLKYMLIVSIGGLFRLTRLVRLHLLDYYRMSVTYGSYVFAFLSGTYLILGNGETIYYNILVYLIVIFAILRVFLVYYRLFGAASFRNIYLISYICTSEVLPLFIGLKFFLIS